MPNSKKEIKISLSALHEVFDHQLHHGVSYGYGIKAPSLNCDSSLIKSIDCSGEVRYLIAKATAQKLIIPDGSQNQRDFFEYNAYKKVSYPAIGGADNSRLFIAFFTPHERGVGNIGHVFLIGRESIAARNETMESYGSHGVGSRQWNLGMFLRRVSACFELPTTK